jgi:hypothetical protein
MKTVKVIVPTKCSRMGTHHPIIKKSDNHFKRFCCRDVEFHFEYNNSLPLAQVYNKHIIEENADKILVFCHDDIVIEDLFLTDKLNEGLEQFDILGLAGNTGPVNIQEPCLWHLMGHGHSGAVGHFSGDSKQPSKRFMTSFGPMPERVVLLDGVFLAINTAKVLESGLKFDENNPSGFHFYDLNFSLDANALQLKLGTWPIWITHQSHGLSEVSSDWEAGQKYFMEKYSKSPN